MIQVIYIAGASRSGSTILDRVLGQVANVVSVGEAMYIWSRGLQEGWACGCGEPFTECDFWKRVLNHVEAKVGELDIDQIQALLGYAGRNRSVPLYMSKYGRDWLEQRVRPHLEIFFRLYEAIVTESGSQLVIDSSKNPGYGFLLNSVPEIQVACVHLVRDPRAVAYSRTRSKRAYGQSAQEFMATHSVLRTSFQWIRFNIAAEALSSRSTGNSMRIRYEDFVVNPRGKVRDVLSLVGKELADLSFLGEHDAQLGQSHSASGNPDRFTQLGNVQIRLDDAWRYQMNIKDRIMVHALTWPQMIRYGYA